MPKLYLKASQKPTGTLKADGSYSGITGKSIDLNLTGNLDNQGRLIAQERLNLHAKNVNNKGVVQGNFVAIRADHNLVNEHTISADSAAQLSAGNDIINQSQSSTYQSKQGQSHASHSNVHQIASIHVGNRLKDATDDNGNPLTTLSIQAGNHLISHAGSFKNQGNRTQLIATNAIELNTKDNQNSINAVLDDQNHLNTAKAPASAAKSTAKAILSLLPQAKMPVLRVRRLILIASLVKSSYTPQATFALKKADKPTNYKQPHSLLTKA